MNPKPDQTYRIDLFPTPFNHARHCISCGYDPRDIWQGHDKIDRDETKTLNERGLCEACEQERARWAARP